MFKYVYAASFQYYELLQASYFRFHHLFFKNFALTPNKSAERAAIIELHRAGKTNSKIVKLLKDARSTVCYTVTRFRELKSTEDCDHGLLEDAKGC